MTRSRYNKDHIHELKDFLRSHTKWSTFKGLQIHFWFQILSNNLKTVTCRETPVFSTHKNQKRYFMRSFGTCLPLLSSLIVGHPSSISIFHLKRNQVCGCFSTRAIRWSVDLSCKRRASLRSSSYCKTWNFPKSNQISAPCILNANDFSFPTAATFSSITVICLSGQ